MKTDMERLLRICLTLLLALLPAVTAWAEEGIKEVMVIGGSQSEVNNLKASLTSQGWHVIDQDLNRGASGDYIYLLYKSESSNGVNNGYITDLYISNAEGTAPNSRTHNGRTYTLVPFDGGNNFKNAKGDLNRGDIAARPYLVPGQSVHGRKVSYAVAHGAEKAPLLFRQTVHQEAAFQGMLDSLNLQFVNYRQRTFGLLLPARFRR